jgi:hypothetical protein
MKTFKKCVAPYNEQRQTSGAKGRAALASHRKQLLTPLGHHYYGISADVIIFLISILYDDTLTKYNFIFGL